MKMFLSIRMILVGKGYQLDYKATLQQAYYEITKRKGYNSKAFVRQTIAIKKSGSRLEELANLKAPTLIIHGGRDPLVIIEHGKKCEEVIPNTTSLFIDNMGHDLPNKYIDKIITYLDKHIQQHK